MEINHHFLTGDSSVCRIEIDRFIRMRVADVPIDLDLPVFLAHAKVTRAFFLRTQQGLDDGRSVAKYSRIRTETALFEKAPSMQYLYTKGSPEAINEQGRPAAPETPRCAMPCSRKEKRVHDPIKDTHAHTPAVLGMRPTWFPPLVRNLIVRISLLYPYMRKWYHSNPRLRFPRKSTCVPRMCASVQSED